jgi:hypothetical protein
MSATGMTGAKADHLIYLVGSQRKSKIVALESGNHELLCRVFFSVNLLIALTPPK